ncbi:RuvB-like protein 1 [Nematocida sp. AWRm80]|nr:RuvB-like protein 1 [Nematocida sp. AWRm80]
MDKGLAHSHINGLGVDKGLNIVDKSGLYGMEEARRAASIFCDMISNKKIAGKALLITGESGSGKTALAVGLSKDLGTKMPFVKMTGSEVYSAELKKTEILQQAIRRATSVRIREIKNVYEGEIIDIKVEEKENPLNNYRKTIEKTHVSLKSMKGSQRITLGAIMSQEIVKQKIAVGDVVYIEADDEIIKKIGRSESYASEFDIESDKYIPMPRGDIYTKKEIVQEMSLHEIDLSNTNVKGDDLFTLLNQITKVGKQEITNKVRAEVDAKISHQISMGAAEIIPGVLFIDESHILDIECYSFISSVLESPTCPVVVFATNKKKCKVAGSDEIGLFGMPAEFLSRLFIVHIDSLQPEQIECIVKEKIAAEKIEISEEGIHKVITLAQSQSLRHAFSILLLAAGVSSEAITAQALDEVIDLFRVCSK